MEERWSGVEITRLVLMLDSTSSAHITCGHLKALTQNDVIVNKNTEGEKHFHTVVCEYVQSWCYYLHKNRNQNMEKYRFSEIKQFIFC